MPPEKKTRTLAYPKPGPTGGVLIRGVVALLREFEITLPLTSHIHIAVSGGADSMALAHLLVHYGRRVGAPKGMTLLHINHGWRGQESEADEAFVRATARKWGVKFKGFKLKPLEQSGGDSWEDLARKERKRIYASLAKKGSVIFTAHHGDDLAETLLWRIFTGSHTTHGGGIAVRSESEIRPFLRTKKEKLKQYLKEEKQGWREDRTNFEGRFLRSKMRIELLPVISRLFPRAVDHLIEIALTAQKQTTSVGGLDPEMQGALSVMFSAAGLRVRQAHWGLLSRQIQGNRSWTGDIHLPGGWSLKRESKNKGSRWVLEKIQAPIITRNNGKKSTR